MPERQPEDVLSLAEAASYLRVPEDEVLRLAEDRNIPAQRIGGEWRFLKGAIDHWLTYGPLAEDRNIPAQRIGGEWRGRSITGSPTGRASYGTTGTSLPGSLNIP